METSTHDAEKETNKENDMEDRLDASEVKKCRVGSRGEGGLGAEDPPSN